MSLWCCVFIALILVLLAMVRYSQALALFLAMACFSSERGEAFSPIRKKLRYPVSGTTVIGSFLHNVSPQDNDGDTQKARVDPSVNRQLPTAESEGKSATFGSYLDNLAPGGSSGVPKSSKPKKQAAYPKRSLEDETNPMMAARSYLDRMSGPPSMKSNVAPSNKPQARVMGSYLDNL
jgi:hypothetical protein